MACWEEKPLLGCDHHEGWGPGTRLVNLSLRSLRLCPEAPQRDKRGPRSVSLRAQLACFFLTAHVARAVSHLPFHVPA